MSEASYVLSANAVSDIEAIYIFGLDRFGPKQAVRYVEELGACFLRLAENPRMGRIAPRIGRNVRSHEHASHVIFYRIADDAAGPEVLVLNVRHGSSTAELDFEY